MQPAGRTLASPGPTKLGRTRQLCSSTQSAGAWLLSWELVAEGPLPWQLPGPGLHWLESQWQPLYLWNWLLPGFCSWYLLQVAVPWQAVACWLPQALAWQPTLELGCWLLGQWYSLWSCWAWHWVTLPYWCINDWLALWWKQYGPANVPCTGVYMAPGSVAFNIFQPEGKPFPFCFHGFRSCLGLATLFGVLCNGLQYCWNLVWVDMDSSGSLEDLKN